MASITHSPRYDPLRPTDSWQAMNQDIADWQITLHMIDYNSQHQTQFEEFSNLCQLELDPGNRWVQLAHLLPWDRIVRIYQENFSVDLGAKAVNPRWIIGAFIIKHKLRLSDEETLQTISENPYMQFFLGLASYHPQPLFSPSLFVEMRKRLGEATFGRFSQMLSSLGEEAEEREGDQQPSSKPKGKLKIDASVADQYIRYPNDLSLVNEARVKTEQIIDLLYEQLRSQWPVKPRTYRQVAHKRYLSQAKKKNTSKSSLRKTLRYLLNCVERNLGHIDQMLDAIGGRAFPLPHKYQRQLWIIRTLYDQQRTMYQQQSNRCTDRIVSISQPHVHPMVRGKAGKRVEFGAKQALSLNQIKAKLCDTSETWIAATLFVLNLSAFAAKAGVIF